MDTIKRNATLIIGVIIALVVGFAIGYAVGEGHSTDSGMPMAPSESTSTTTPSSTTPVMGGTPANPTQVGQGDSVVIADQSAGMSVAVQSATFTQEAWIAVRDAQGRTLGAALFPAGSEANVSVPLLRATTKGETYQALIYFDDGTKTFNLKTETIVLNNDGSVAGTTFVAQ